MARKLSSDEAQAFSDAVDAGRIPADAQALRRLLHESKDETAEFPISPGLLENGSPETFSS